MANSVLYRSSLLLGGLHLIFAYYFKSDYRIVSVYTIGVVTSIANHGLTSNLLKWMDRCIMIIGTITDIIYITNLPSFRLRGGLLIAFYITAYFSSKYSKVPNVIPHVFTHIFATILHVCLLCSCNNKKER